MKYYETEVEVIEMTETRVKVKIPERKMRVVGKIINCASEEIWVSKENVEVIMPATPTLINSKS